MESPRSGLPPTAVRLALALGVAIPPALFVFVIAFTNVPLGVVGEWVWNRSPEPPTEWSLWVFPVAFMSLLLVVAAVGTRLLNGSVLREIGLVLLLLLAGGAFQWNACQLPMPGWGVERWPAALYYRSTTGYFAVARQITDLPGFLRDYPSWVKQADNFHLGTHPPGLIVLPRMMLDFFDRHPNAVARVDKTIPTVFRDGLETLPPSDHLSDSELAVLWMMSLLALVSNLATGVLVYLLARMLGDRHQAWWGLAFWLAAPANVVFLPLTDVYYSCLAMGAIALCLGSQRTSTGLFAIFGGVILGLGLSLSLAFLAVGAVCGIALVLESMATQRYARGLLSLFYLAAGIALTVCYWFYAFQLNMFDVWSTNLEKHRGFYDLMPRSYWPWTMANLLDYAWMAGPGVVLVGVGGVVGSLRGWDSACRLGLAWLVTLTLLELSGRNLGEVARLWLFLTPLALVVASRWLGSTGWLALLALVGQSVLTLFSVGWVEPLLPVRVDG